MLYEVKVTIGSLKLIYTKVRRGILTCAILYTQLISVKTFNAPPISLPVTPWLKGFL